MQGFKICHCQLRDENGIVDSSSDDISKSKLIYPIECLLNEFFFCSLVYAESVFSKCVDFDVDE